MKAFTTGSVCPPCAHMGSCIEYTTGKSIKGLFFPHKFPLFKCRRWGLLSYGKSLSRNELKNNETVPFSLLLRMFLRICLAGVYFDESELCGCLQPLKAIWTLQAEPIHPHLAITHFLNLNRTLVV